MLNQGVLLLIAGISTVFVFLALMVFVMQITGKFFIIYEARFKETVPDTAPRKPVAGEEIEMIAAVLAAINAHLRK